MWVGLSEACEGVCFGWVGVVDNVGGDTCEEVEVGVDVVPLVAESDEFVYRHNVTGNNASSEVQEVVWDEPKVEHSIGVEVVVES